MEDEKPPFKRRRLNVATALSKPFKSPLCRPALTETSSELTSLSPELATPPKNSSRFDLPETPINEKQNQPTPPAGPPAIVLDRPPKIPAIKTPTRSSPSDPEILSLARQQRTLQSRLATLRSDLDTVRQALRIESSGKEAELEGLIIKWRLVSQAAAEEVFASAQERVARMGGMAGWRERSKRDTMQWAYDDAPRLPGQTEMEGIYCSSYNSSDQRNHAGFHEDEEHNEEFTMEVMLETLNIEPALIGLDLTMGNWIRDI